MMLIMKLYCHFDNFDIDLLVLVGWMLKKEKPFLSPGREGV